MVNELIGCAEAYVKELFENEYTGHDYFHTLRVFRTATRIAEEENADAEVVQLAALLHDVDDRKLSPDTYENLGNARAFLTANGVDDGRIETICRVIREISFGANDAPPTTLEGMCVQDADRLDAIGAIGIGRAFAYGGSHQRLMHHPNISPSLNMTKEEYRASKSTTINHFYEKLFLLTDMMNTEAAKRIAKSREEYMRGFVDEFMAEWDGIR